MTESLFYYARTIYCVKESNSFLRDFFVAPSTYKSLKEVYTKLHYNNYYNSEIAAEVRVETCDDLIRQCQTEFGEDFQYVQSGEPGVPWWDTVQASGEICPHLYVTEHDNKHYEDI